MSMSLIGKDRYNKVSKKLAEEGTKSALSKAQQIKNGKTATGQQATPVNTEPEANITVGGLR